MVEDITSRKLYWYSPRAVNMSVGAIAIGLRKLPSKHSSVSSQNHHEPRDLPQTTNGQ